MITKQFIYLLIVPVLLFSFFATGCRQTSDTASLGQFGITTAINNDNSPFNNFEQVVISTAPEIYLSTQIIDAIKGTKVQVEWRYVTGDQTIATEIFKGERSSDKPHEFIIGTSPTTSFFSSRIILSDINWLVGSYEVIIMLNNRAIQRADFNIVNDSDFDQLSKKAMLENLYLGSMVNKENQIAVPGDNFARDQEKIYAVALFRNVPAGTTIKASWAHLDTNRVITNFSVPFSGADYLPFEISLSRFSRLWPSGLWPTGTYKVSIYVDNVLVTTRNFTVS